ncbi:DUF2142 domain-containing protein [Bifidobacterium sp.]|uniref:DUF2142 domain-containing protein n=2 Tax=Bifidobacterium sp. TaxID=41200 RepID=UPI0039EC0DB5
MGADTQGSERMMPSGAGPGLAIKPARSHDRSQSFRDRHRRLMRAIPVLIFVMLCLSESAWFMARLGPLTSPDPDMHGPTIYSLATGRIFSPVHREVDAVGNPVKRQSLSGDSQFLFLGGKRNILDMDAIQLSLKGDPGTWQQRLSNNQPRQQVSIPDRHHANRSNQYFPLLYLPQAIGLRTAMWSGMTPYSSWQMARITNVIVFMLLWGTAICMIPRGKWVLAMIGGMPSIVFLASSLMSDGNIIALCGIFAAIVLKCIETNRPLARLGRFIVGLLFLLLLYSKILYAVPVLVLLLLPHRLMTAKAKASILLVPMAVFAATYMPWSMHFGGMLAIGNIARNTHQMIAHPLHTAMVILRSMTNLPHMFVHQPIWFLPQFIVLLAVWLFSLICVLSRNQSVAAYRRGPWQWLSENRYFAGMLVLCFISIFMMYGALALTWNNLQALNADRLGGFQVRYIYPLLSLSTFALVSDARCVDNREFMPRLQPSHDRACYLKGGEAL